MPVTISSSSSSSSRPSSLRGGGQQQCRWRLVLVLLLASAPSPPARRRRRPPPPPRPKTTPQRRRPQQQQSTKEGRPAPRPPLLSNPRPVRSSSSGCLPCRSSTPIPPTHPTHPPHPTPPTQSTQPTSKPTHPQVPDGPARALRRWYPPYHHQHLLRLCVRLDLCEPVQLHEGGLATLPCLPQPGQWGGWVVGWVVCFCGFRTSYCKLGLGGWVGGDESVCLSLLPIIHPPTHPPTPPQAADAFGSHTEDKTNYLMAAGSSHPPTHPPTYQTSTTFSPPMSFIHPPTHPPQPPTPAASSSLSSSCLRWLMWASRSVPPTHPPTPYSSSFEPPLPSLPSHQQHKSSSLNHPPTHPKQ